MKFPNKIPDIKVLKYLLRECKQSDIPISYSYLTDPETIEDTSYDIKNMEEMKERVNFHKQQFKDKKRIGWIIEDTETGKMIGEISFFDIEIANRKGEIGYFLGKEFWRQGIMSSILEVVIAYLFEDLKIHRLQAVVIKENSGSIRLLEKNGFVKEGMLKDYKYCRNRYRDFVIYSKINNG